MEIYTIGYTAFSEYNEKGDPVIAESNINRFISVLKKYKITCLIDVRSEPHSGTRREFNKDNLKQELEKNKILYRNYAKEFGARQTDKSLYDIEISGNEHRLNFSKVIASDQFQSGIEKVKKGIDLGYVFCLMCSEADPIKCHRAIMVGRGFKNAGFDVTHIVKKSEKNSTEDNQIENVETAIEELPCSSAILNEEELKECLLDKTDEITQEDIEKHLIDCYVKKEEKRKRK